MNVTVERSLDHFGEFTTWKWRFARDIFNRQTKNPFRMKEIGFLYDHIEWNDGMGNETKKRPTTYDIDVRKIVLRWQMR